MVVVVGWIQSGCGSILSNWDVLTQIGRVNWEFETGSLLSWFLDELAVPSISLWSGGAAIRQQCSCRDVFMPRDEANVVLMDQEMFYMWSSSINLIDACLQLYILTSLHIKLYSLRYLSDSVMANDWQLWSCSDFKNECLSPWAFL